MDNNDFKLVAQNGKSVSVILDFTKLSYEDLYYSMALLRDDGFIPKRWYVLHYNGEKCTPLQLPVGEVLLTSSQRKECKPIRIFTKIIL